MQPESSTRTGASAFLSSFRWCPVSSVDLLTTGWISSFPLKGVFLACVLYFLPFSPRWLAGKGRDQECLDTLVRLRKLPSSDPRVQAEWITIRTEALHNREALLSRHPKNSGTGIANELRLEMASWVDMFRPAVIKRTHIGIGLMFFQQFVGINAVSMTDISTDE
jgi:hypothetical protein